MRRNPYRFKVYESAYQQWRWRVTAGHGKIVQSSSESFSTKAAARRNARLLGLAALAVW